MSSTTRPSPRPGNQPPTTPSPSPSPTVQFAADRTRRPRRRTLVIGLAALVVLLLAVDLALLAVSRPASEPSAAAVTRSLDSSPIETARREALASATKRIPALLSYDYRSMTAFASSAPANATGVFRTRYQTLVESVIEPAALADKITTKTAVKLVGVIRASATQVDLLMFLDQATTTAANPSPRLDGSRVQVTMRRVRTQWLVADLGQT